MDRIRIACAHDCPCMCSLIATVENGRVVDVSGDPEQPYTAGFACVCPGGDNGLNDCEKKHRVEGSVAFVPSVFGLTAAATAVQLIVGARVVRWPGAQRGATPQELR